MPSWFKIESNATLRSWRVGNVFSAVLDVFYPPRCVYCTVGPATEGGPFLCGPCRDGIVFIEGNYCFQCGFPADISYDYPNAEFKCGRCRKGSYVFDQARSLGIYDSALKTLIHHFKYRKQPGVMKEIASLMDTHWSVSGENYHGFHIVPVPLHKDKLRERGFDQSYLIARHMAGRLELPFWDDLLMRVKATESQTIKRKSERQKNIQAAFALTRPEEARGQDILLVDDVFTTGSTANEAAKVFKRAGAGRVHVFTLARA